MRPGNLMWLGFITGLCGIALCAVSGLPLSAFVAFCGGAVFGKGYGIWQDRSGRAALAEDET